MSGRHIGLGPGPIDENDAGRIKLALVLLPSCPPPGDVRSMLLAGVQAFFEGDAFALEEEPDRVVAYPARTPARLSRFSGRPATLSTPAAGKSRSIAEELAAPRSCLNRGSTSSAR